MFKSKIDQLRLLKRNQNSSQTYRSIMKYHIPDKFNLNIPYIKSTNNTIKKYNRYLNYLLFSNSRVLITNNKIINREKIRKGVISLSIFTLISYLIFSTANISKKVRGYVTYPFRKLVNDILISEELESGGRNLLHKLFENEKTKTAVIILLGDVMKDDRFMTEGVNFGKNLFINVLQNEEIREEIIKVFVRVLLSENTKSSVISLFRSVTSQVELEQILSQFLKVIFTREDIYSSLFKLFSDVVVKLLNDEATKTKFADFLAMIWANQSLRWNIIKKTVDFTSVSPASITISENKEVKTNEEKKDE